MAKAQMIEDLIVRLNELKKAEFRDPSNQLDYKDEANALLDNPDAKLTNDEKLAIKLDCIISHAEELETLGKHLQEFQKSCEVLQNVAEHINHKKLYFNAMKYLDEKHSGLVQQFRDLEIVKSAVDNGKMTEDALGRAVELSKHDLSFTFRDFTSSPVREIFSILNKEHVYHDEQSLVKQLNYKMVKFFSENQPELCNEYSRIYPYEFELLKLCGKFNLFPQGAESELRNYYYVQEIRARNQAEYDQTQAKLAQVEISGSSAADSAESLPKYEAEKMGDTTVDLYS